MPRPSHITLPLLLLLLCTPQVDAQQGANTLSPAEAKAGWTLIFDGRTLSGLLPNGEADWKVEDGTLTATKGTGFLITPKSYGNFELKADFWADKSVNSGIFIRCADGTPGAMTCYEVNIFDAHAEWPTGSVNNVKTVLPEQAQHHGKMEHVRDHRRRHPSRHQDQRQDDGGRDEMSGGPTARSRCRRAEPTRAA